MISKLNAFSLVLVLTIFVGTAFRVTQTKVNADPLGYATITTQIVPDKDVVLDDQFALDYFHCVGGGDLRNPFQFKSLTAASPSATVRVAIYPPSADANNPNNTNCYLGVAVHQPKNGTFINVEWPGHSLNPSENFRVNVGDNITISLVLKRLIPPTQPISSSAPLAMISPSPLVAEPTPSVVQLSPSPKETPSQKIVSPKASKPKPKPSLKTPQAINSPTLMTPPSAVVSVTPSPIKAVVEPSASRVHKTFLQRFFASLISILTFWR